MTRSGIELRKSWAKFRRSIRIFAELWWACHWNKKSFYLSVCLSGCLSGQFDEQVYVLIPTTGMHCLVLQCLQCLCYRFLSLNLLSVLPEIITSFKGNLLPVMPRSQMACNSSAADFPSISCDDRAILRSRQDGSCDNCCSCSDRRHSSAELNIFFRNRRHRRVGGGEVTSCRYSASLVQASYNVCAMPARF